METQEFIVDDETGILIPLKRVGIVRDVGIPCDACKESDGNVITCGNCPAAYHVRCHDPSMTEDAIIPDKWLCHHCSYLEKTDKETDPEIPKPSRDQNLWDDITTRLLINEYAEKIEQVKVQNIPSLEKMWLAIEMEFARQGYAHTCKQLKYKWRNLEKSYRSAEDYRRRSGGSTKRTCPFYEELNFLLGKKPKSIPVTMAETLVIPDHPVSKDDIFTISSEQPMYEEVVGIVAQDETVTGSMQVEENQNSVTGDISGFENVENSNTPATTGFDNVLWNEATTKLLLKEYSSKIELVKVQQIPSLEKMWPAIQTEFAKRGYNHTWKQLKYKWRTLERSYMSVQKTGRKRKIFPFYEELDAIIRRTRQTTIRPSVMMAAGRAVRKYRNIAPNDGRRYIQPQVVMVDSSGSQSIIPQASAGAKPDIVMVQNAEGAGNATDPLTNTMLEAIKAEIAQLRQEQSDRFALEEATRQNQHEQLMKVFEQHLDKMEEMNNILQSLVKKK